MTTYPTKKRRGNAIVLAASILVLLVIDSHHLREPHADCSKDADCATVLGR